MQYFFEEFQKPFFLGQNFQDTWISSSPENLQLFGNIYWENYFELKIIKYVIGFRLQTKKENNEQSYWNWEDLDMNLTDFNPSHKKLNTPNNNNN